MSGMRLRFTIRGIQGHPGGIQGHPGASRGIQGHPGASREHSRGRVALGGNSQGDPAPAIIRSIAARDLALTVDTGR